MQPVLPVAFGAFNQDLEDLTMNVQYVPLDNMRRALTRANGSWNTFCRLCAVSSHSPMGWAHRWIPTEPSKATI